MWEVRAWKRLKTVCGSGGGEEDLGGEVKNVK